MMAIDHASAADIGVRGERMYEQLIRPLVERDHHGMYLVLDVATGEYTVGDDILTLTRRMRESRPEAQLYSLRIGFEDTGRIGGFIASGTP